MYTIKDAAKQVKTSIGNLKNWEKIFEKYLQVHRTKSGSRIYSETELIVLKKIKLMKDKKLSDEMVMFILETNNGENLDIPEEILSEYDLKYADIVALQTEAVQAVHNISSSLHQFKGEFIKEVKQELTSEVKKEISKGNAITEGIVQTFSHKVLDTCKSTHDQISKLHHEFEKEEEEKLFLQKKVEEREELFQEFVQSYRQSAAANEARKAKRTLTYWVNFLMKAPIKWTKL